MEPTDEDEALAMPITAALLENQHPIAPNTKRGARMRAKLLATVRSKKNGGAKNSNENIAVKERLYTLRAPDGEWINLSADIALKILRRDNHSRSFLLRLAPGSRIPPHAHIDVDEECYVLEGDVHIDDLHLRAGDFHVAPRGAAHGWLWSDTGALLLLRGDLQTHFLSEV